MARLEETRRRKEGAESLLSIAGAMKALAAVRIRRCRQAVDAVAAYRETVEMGLQVALAHRPRGVPVTGPPEEGRAAVLAFGSDLGLAGGFNAAVAEAAAAACAADGGGGAGGAGPRLLAVGERVAPHLAAAGVAVTEVVPAPGSVEALAPTAQDLLAALSRWRREGAVSRVILVHGGYRRGGVLRPRSKQLLPLDPAWLGELESRPWPSRVLPMAWAPWEELFSRLVREHLFAAVFRALAESQAGEHAARLASMEAAERRIESHLVELDAALRLERQETVTAELLELATGYEALVAGGDDETT